MIKVFSIGSAPSFLLPYQPNWRAGIETRFEIPAKADRGLTGREARRAFGTTLRVETEFELLLEQADAAAFRNALQDADLAKSKVVFPFWPGVRAYGDTEPVPFATGRWLFTSASGYHAVHDTPDPMGPFPGGLLVVPVLEGRLVDPPRCEALTDEVLKVRVRLRDEGPPERSLQVTSEGFASGPETGGRTPPLFPLRVNFGEGVETGNAEVEIDHRQLGFCRAESSVLYPQNPARTFAFPLRLVSLEDAAALLKFFAERQAVTETFWLPSHLAETRLALDTSATVPIIPITGTPAAFGQNRFVAFTDPERTVARRIEEFTIFEAFHALRVNSSPGRFLAANTSLSTLALARFAKPSLTLQWGSNGEADARVEFREVPTEYQVATGEALGVTVGALPRRAFLYTFRVNIPQAASHQRVQVAFIVDRSGSMSGDVQAVRNSIERILDALLPSVAPEWAMVSYSDDYGRKDLDFTDDRQALDNALGALTFAGSVERGYDAIHLACTGLSWREDSAKFLFLLTDEDADTGNYYQRDVIPVVQALGAKLFYGFQYFSVYQTIADETGGELIDASTDFASEFATAINASVEHHVWRYTSFEKALNDQGTIYQPIAIEHGDIRESLNLEKNEVTLRTRVFEGHPLLLFIPFRLEFPMEMEVLETETYPGGLDAYNTRRLFKGEVIAVDTDGPFLTARAVNAGNLFERKLPRWLLQPTCNWALFDSACGLDRAAWRVDGQIVDAFTSNTFRLRVRLAGGSGIAENFFAGGWLETAKDNVLATRGISGSTVPNAANEVELTISSDLSPWPAHNQPISLYPGCDGRRESCLNRFRNYPRFGGFPFMPVGNPSMIKMPANRNIK